MQAEHFGKYEDRSPDRGAYPSDLGWEQFGVVAQAGAEASRDQEIQDQSHPEQAGRTVEMSSDHQKDRRWEHKARDNVTPAAEVAEPAAKVIGKDAQRR